MIKQALFLFLLLITTFQANAHLRSDRSNALKINLFCADRSGLAKDHAILRTTLESFGCKVSLHTDNKNFDLEHADLNIFCESLYPQCFSSSTLNWFIPNPEWIWDGLDHLDSVDLILCRTHEVERIFNDLAMKTHYIGFFSPNCYSPDIEKDYNLCLHVAGTSTQKGTLPLLEAWNFNPGFPHLTAIRFSEPSISIPQNCTWIKKWIPEQQLRRLQNTCGIHLCVTETEGFGHFLVEAMSTKAVVITTDAPPMNEFITDPRCLVPYSSWSIQGLGTNYYVDSKAIEETIRNILLLSPTELAEIGNKNRERYLKYHKNFRSNLEKLLDQI